MGNALGSVPHGFKCRFRSQVSGYQTGVVGAIVVRVPLARFREASVCPYVMVGCERTPRRERHFYLTLFVRPALCHLGCGMVDQEPFFRPTIRRGGASGLVLLMYDGRAGVFFVCDHPFPTVLRFRIRATVEAFAIFLVFLVPPYVPAVRAGTVPLYVALRVVRGTVFVNVALLDL